MNDPDPRDNRRPDAHGTGGPSREGLPRKSSSPLLWILLLIALAAIGWYFYSQRGPVQGTEAPPGPVGNTPEIGDGSPPPPASEQPARMPEPSADAGATRDARLLQPPAPTYPPAAVRAGEEGMVMLRATVDRDGHPQDVEVVTSSRSRELDRAALEAVRAARFLPALRDGRPIVSKVNVPVDFRLDDNATAQR